MRANQSGGYKPSRTAVIASTARAHSSCDEKAASKRLYSSSERGAGVDCAAGASVLRSAAKPNAWMSLNSYPDQYASVQHARAICRPVAEALACATCLRKRALPEA